MIVVMILTLPAVAGGLSRAALGPQEAWETLESEPDEGPALAPGWEGRVFWDLRPLLGAGARRFRHEVREPAGARLAGLAVCTAELAGGDPLAWTCRESAPRRTEPRFVAEGIVLLPAGPRRARLAGEPAEGGLRAVWRFVGEGGFELARLEGAAPAPGEPFRPDRVALLAAAEQLADDGITIPYEKLAAALRPQATGFLQYSVESDTAFGALDPAWSTIADLISTDATSVPYQPDPGDPSTSLVLPEVWEFAGLDATVLDFRTFNTTRDDPGGNVCGEACSVRNVGPAPPDGTWQSYLKIDNYAPDASFYTRDLFLINDNDTGADPSIDVPFVAQDELNADDRTQACFQQSAGGAQRLLRFFRFLGPDPASAVLGSGDSWTSGAWTSCSNANGLRLTVASVCGDQCYPGCDAPASPRARGLLGSGAGFRATIVEDGWVHVAAGNYLPALLMRQDSDLEGGADFFGVCNVSPQRLRAFDYFWIQEDYGLLALVSSPNSVTITATDWSAAGNVTDGADFTWGPFPPWQMEAEACLAGTLVRWALPADGSNLTGEPGVSDWGYVVSWGLGDAAALADWDTNPLRTPRPGEPGFLAAAPGGEPTSWVITGWLGGSIDATVVTALRYLDPDVGDVTAYRSAAQFKVTEDPARLDPSIFRVGNEVAPFVERAGADLELSWPAVPGAASYVLRVWDLATRQEIACPPGLDCAPAIPSAIHLGGASGPAAFGYRAFAVDACGGASAN